MNDSHYLNHNIKNLSLANLIEAVTKIVVKMTVLGNKTINSLLISKIINKYNQNVNMQKREPHCTANKNVQYISMRTPSVKYNSWCVRYVSISVSFIS